MADLDLGAHGAQVATAAGIVSAAIAGAVSRFFALRREEKSSEQAEGIRTKLALIEQRLGDFLGLMKLYGELAGKVALVERDVVAAHRRMDDSLGKRS